MPKREECLLRSMTAEDLERVLRWRNSQRVRQYSFTDHIITMDEHRGWFERVTQEKTAVPLVFELMGKPVGLVHFNAFDRQNNRCSWGFYLGEGNVPRGTGKAMGFLALEYLFEILRVRKLCAEAFAFNEASLRYHLQLGFMEEGRFRRHVLKNGVYEDVVCFAHFADRWREIKPRLEQEIFSGTSV